MSATNLNSKEVEDAHENGSITSLESAQTIMPTDLSARIMELENALVTSDRQYATQTLRMKKEHVKMLVDTQDQLELLQNEHQELAEDLQDVMILCKEQETENNQWKKDYHNLQLSFTKLKDENLGLLEELDDAREKLEKSRAVEDRMLQLQRSFQRQLQGLEETKRELKTRMISSELALQSAQDSLREVMQEREHLKTRINILDKSLKGCNCSSSDKTNIQTNSNGFQLRHCTGKRTRMRVLRELSNQYFDKSLSRRVSCVEAVMNDISCSRTVVDPRMKANVKKNATINQCRSLTLLGEYMRGNHNAKRDLNVEPSLERSQNQNATWDSPSKFTIETNCNVFLEALGSSNTGLNVIPKITNQEGDHEEVDKEESSIERADDEDAASVWTSICTSLQGGTCAEGRFLSFPKVASKAKINVGGAMAKALSVAASVHKLEYSPSFRSKHSVRRIETPNSILCPKVDIELYEGWPS